MQQLLYKTKSGGSPQDKPRVYFTCHPDDFDRTFPKVCEDIFKTHDCVIYYTADMNELLPEDTREFDLERMNMFVIPVTFKLMTTPNRANDFDLWFAKERNIAILPIMFETKPDINLIYSRPENFGNRQYLAPFERDPTAISYEEKLKKYLESTLFDDKTVERIRKAFDAYIFLSYRKMDRVYANDLIKLIHSDPRFRDLAVWYDEFLPVGSAFDKEIEKALSLSKLFALAVTPNLAKYTPEGNPNYIMTKEYPKAKKSILDPQTGKMLPIIPVQVADMDEKDWQTLSESKEFSDIPDIVDGRKLPTLSEVMYESLKQIALQKNANNPEHNYLIGLAYLNGIDVEMNVERARELFENAHRAGVLDATKQLSKMYSVGLGTEYNPQKAYEYELKVLEVISNQKDTEQSKRRLANEYVDAAQICSLGKSSRFEPSPSKLLSIESAIQYYQNAIELLCELFNEFPSKEDDVFSICDYLAVLCHILASGGAETWSNLDHAEIIQYLQKWVWFSTLSSHLSDSFKWIMQKRDAYRMLLQEIGYDSNEYEDVLRKTVKAAETVVCHDESGPPDYIRVIEIMCDNGVSYYQNRHQYDKAAQWLHSCFLTFDKYHPQIANLSYTFIGLSSETFKEQLDFRLSLISRKCINVIYDLLEQDYCETVERTIGSIMCDLEQYSDRNDTILRNILLPGIRNMIKKRATT